MIPRKLAVPTLLAASVAIPYGATNAPQWAQQWRGTLTAATAKTSPTNPAGTPAQMWPRSAAALAASPQGPNATLFPTHTPLEGIQTYSLGDVLRMDVSKEWVYQRWPRKSTALAELDLFGVRVPLVTGTKLYDLAGSLTYFFGADGRVKRISFRGHTGDTTQVVSLVAQRFGLQPQPTPVVGEQLLQVRRGEDVLSELRTHPAPVLWESSPHDSFSVELELQDPTARPLKRPASAASSPAATPTASTPAKFAPANGSPAEAAKSGSATATEASKPDEPAWKAYFPRSRVPKAQVQNLVRGNVYQ